MSSMTAQLGDEIVKVINDSKIVTATRLYNPEIDLKEIDRSPRIFIRSSVMETPIEAPPHSRGHRFIDIAFALLLAARVDGKDITDVDDIVGLYEDIEQSIFENGRMLTIEKTGIVAQWISSQIDTNVNVEKLRTTQLVQISGQIVYRYSR